MTITKFIEKLEELKAAHGDIPVVTGSMIDGYYEPDPEALCVGLTVRDKRRFATVTTLCAVIH